MPKLRPAPLQERDYKRVFGIRGLPKLNRPLVLFTGSGIGDVLENSRKITVNTVHGKALLLVGKIRGVNDLDVVVVPRHADPSSKEVGHHRLPHQVNEPAYSVAIAALNPRAVVTMHTIGVAKTHASYKPGAITVIKGLLRTRPSKTIYNEEVTNALRQANYDIPAVAHAAVNENRIKNPKLTEIITTAARSAGLPVARELICHTTEGPAYETDAEVRDLVSRGVNGFSMTHQHEAITIQEALQALGSNSKVVSIATISNFAQGFGTPPSHEEVARTVKALEGKRTYFLQNIARLVRKL